MSATFIQSWRLFIRTLRLFCGSTTGANAFFRILGIFSPWECTDNLNSVGKGSPFKSAESKRLGDAVLRRQKQRGDPKVRCTPGHPVSCRYSACTDQYILISTLPVLISTGSVLISTGSVLISTGSVLISTGSVRPGVGGGGWVVVAVAAVAVVAVAVAAAVAVAVAVVIPTPLRLQQPTVVLEGGWRGNACQV